ncbi:hypothetical protein XENTR_v10005393 [Xenopus tropicalis]|nr:hypothetical protein XENTR_v10005393 [Xenopus tropicalis]
MGQCYMTDATIKDCCAISCLGLNSQTHTKSLSAALTLGDALTSTNNTAQQSRTWSICASLCLSAKAARMMLMCCLRELKKVYLLWSLLSILILLEASSTDPKNATETPTTTITTKTSTNTKTTETLNVVTPTMPKYTTTTTLPQIPSTISNVITTAYTKSTEPAPVTQNSTAIPADIKTTTVSENLTSSVPNTTTSTSPFNQNISADSYEAFTTAASSFPPLATTISNTTYSSPPDSTNSDLENEIQQNSTGQVKVNCDSLKNYVSNEKVVCFEYREKVKCEDFLKPDKGNLLKSVLCNVTNSDTSQCNLTLYTSETNQQCILWVLKGLASKDENNAIESHRSKLQKEDIELKWQQISDHQTKTKKTMIALVTLGVLLAFFILTGYYMSNRESWTPGRQRLGEDPYYTETDSQGNTLVSVSSHTQEKANNETRENGTGQASTPTTTNGHSTKKQTMSDTKV